MEGGPEGYLSSIHKKDCPSLKRIIASAENANERIVHALWDEATQPLHKVIVKVIAHDRKGLLRDISEAISAMNISILASSSKSFPLKNQAILKFQIAVEDSQQLNELLKKISTIKEVISLTRVTRQ